MSLTFATGVTPNFEPRAERFWPSIRQHQIPFLVFLVNYGNVPSIYDGLAVQRVNYADVICKVPKTQMQHGAFTQFWRGSDNDVVAYCDADARWQRHLTPVEITMLSSVGPNEFMAARNNPDPTQTLAQEAQCIFPQLPADQLARIWPGYETMLCRNFGFVVARISTWKRIYAGVRKLWANADRCFKNPAVVQFVSLYSAYSQGITLRTLPDSIHSQGHLGLFTGLEQGTDGLWRANGEVVAFAHAL